MLSPYEKGKPEIREKYLPERSGGEQRCHSISQTGRGQDELVFDGLSMVYDQRGALVARGRQFRKR